MATFENGGGYNDNDFQQLTLVAAKKNYFSTRQKYLNLLNTRGPRYEQEFAEYLQWYTHTYSSEFKSSMIAYHQLIAEVAFPNSDMDKFKAKTQAIPVKYHFNELKALDPQATLQDPRYRQLVKQYVGVKSTLAEADQSDKEIQSLIEFENDISINFRELFCISDFEGVDFFYDRFCLQTLPWDEVVIEYRRLFASSEISQQKSLYAKLIGLKTYDYQTLITIAEKTPVVSELQDKQQGELDFIQEQIELRTKEIAEQNSADAA